MWKRVRLRKTLPPCSIRPDYGGCLLSNVPSAVLTILGESLSRPTLPRGALGVEISGVTNAVLIVCDGLGMNEWLRKPVNGFSGTLTKEGAVKPITIAFPSTTAG